MAETDQTVVTETDGGAKPGPEATDARKPDDLDALLAEFETVTRSTASKPETKPEAEPVEPGVAKRLETLEKALTERQVQEDLAPVIKTIKDGLPPGFFDDKEIEDLLEGRARRDPRLANAWLNRRQNPEAWAKVTTALTREISGKFKKLPDAAATEDREAVTAAVRGASTQPPPSKAPDYSKQSNNDFAQQVEKDYGFRPL